MSKLKAMIGVLVASALCICVFGVSSASALTHEECNGPGNSTAVACSGGVWRAASGTVYETFLGGLIRIGATIGGVEFIVSCKKGSGSGTSENVESGGNMHVKSTGIVTKFEECATTKPVQCTVPATIETKSLKSTTVSGTMSQKYEPTEGTTFASFEIGGASCPAALKGVKSVTGTATSTMTEAQEVAGEQVFNITKFSGELKFAGQNAEFSASKKFCTLDGTQVFTRTP